MRIFKTKNLARFARRARIDDASLVEAVDRAERGLIDADLGGGLIKQRVVRAGQGKRGGYRMLIAYRIDDLAIFLFGFAKGDLDNIDDDDLEDLRTIARIWLGDAVKVATDLAKGILIEVHHDDEG